MTTINDIWTAYEEGEGHWTGCNWPTRYGSLGLDLDGVSSGQAHRNANRWRAIAADEIPDGEVAGGEEAALVDMALHLRLRGAVICRVEDRSCRLEVCGSPARHFCAEVLAREWEFVSAWLEEIESDARWADQEAKDAVRSAEDGDWEQAVAHAGQACQIESGYANSRPWRRLKQVIENAALG